MSGRDKATNQLKDYQKKRGPGVRNYLSLTASSPNQGCISCGILVSGIGARGVSSEHMENMEMFSCSPT